MMTAPDIVFWIFVGVLAGLLLAAAGVWAAIRILDRLKRSREEKRTRELSSRQVDQMLDGIRPLTDSRKEPSS